MRRCAILWSSERRLGVQGSAFDAISSDRHCRLGSLLFVAFSLFLTIRPATRERQMRRILYRAVVLGVSVPLIQGCGTTLMSSRSTNPVIQDFAHRWLGKESVLSTTASRRLALMSYQKDANGNEHVVTCAEPPPDVGETIAKAIAAQLEVSAPLHAGEAKVGGGFSDQAATAIAPLLTRTQGLQILRDSTFTLCVDFMNGWIADAQTYQRIKGERFDKAIALIEKELALQASKPAAPLARLDPPALPPAPIPPRPGGPGQ
jgi:hypothetical protein